MSISFPAVRCIQRSPSMFALRGIARMLLIQLPMMGRTTLKQVYLYLFNPAVRVDEVLLCAAPHTKCSFTYFYLALHYFSIV